MFKVQRPTLPALIEMTYPLILNSVGPVVAAGYYPFQKAGKPGILGDALFESEIDLLDDHSQFETSVDVVEKDV